MFDVDAIRQDFPILNQTSNGKPLVYLDSAASSQKPSAVIDAVDTCYREYYANVHRGIYDLSEKSSDEYERARKKVARFINARSWRELIFTRNATEALNLVAYSWGLDNLHAGDTILVSDMEHHANLVPWQQVARKTGATLTFFPTTADGLVDMQAYKSLLHPSVKLVTFTLMSHVRGTLTPAAEMIEVAQ